MKKEKATLQEWRDLYEIASRFKKLECWNWMSDEEIFGVQNPETGEIGYCCIMGMIGQFFGMGVYLGDEGLQSYKTLIRIPEDEDEATGFEKALSQKCLMVSFEDKKALTREDKNIIKKLGLKFRGANGWPIFRDYSPYLRPWFLNREQVIYLTTAIRQAIEVILRYQENEDLLYSGKDGEFLVRIIQKNKMGESEWHDKWIKPKPYKIPKIETPEIDMSRLHKIREACYNQSSIWEIDSTILPTTVSKRKDIRPYYPKSILWADTPTNLIIDFFVSPEIKPADLLNKTLSLIEKMEQIPKEILVTRPEYVNIFKPICAVLKIKLKQVDSLQTINDAKNEMFHDKRFY